MKNNAKVFYLPVSKRPLNFGPLPEYFKDFWHVGILYEGRVYENFSGKRFMVSEEERRVPELNEMGAEWQEVILKYPQNLEKFLKEGMSCDNYVEKVLGLESTEEKWVIKRDLTKETGEL